MEELKEKYVGKYVGPYEITDIETTDQKTPKDSVVFLLTFKGGEKMIMPEKGLVAVVTDKNTDHTYIRDARVAAMIQELIDIVEEYDLPATQIVNLSQTFANQLASRFDRAHTWFWHKDPKKFIPGYDPLNEVSLLMAEKVISEIPKNEPGK